jgi:chromosome segregation ATPase
MGKNRNQSLETLIKGQMNTFNDPKKDDNAKKVGLAKIIKKVSSLKDSNNEQDLKNNKNELDKVKEKFKDSIQFTGQLEELGSILAKSDPPEVTPSTPKTKKIKSVGNKTKAKQEQKPPKKESLKKKIPSNSKDGKLQSNVKRHPQKTSNNNDNILLGKIDKIIKKEIVPLAEILTNIENKVKNLEKDLDHKVSQITKKNKEIQETLDELDVLPANFKKLTDKFDTLNEAITNLNAGGGKKSKNDVPKDVQAIEELTKYMGDGLQQFDHIAKYYVSQQTQFEKNEKLQANLDSKINENKELAFKEGGKKSKVAIARKIHKSHPTDFNQFKSIFEDIMSERYKVNEKITTTSENLQELETEIEDKLEVGTTYIIKTPATLIDNEILIKATVEESK